MLLIVTGANLYLIGGIVCVVCIFYTIIVSIVCIWQLTLISNFRYFKYRNLPLYISETSKSHIARFLLLFYWWKETLKLTCHLFSCLSWVTNRESWVEISQQYFIISLLLIRFIEIIVGSAYLEAFRHLTILLSMNIRLAKII